MNKYKTISPQANRESLEESIQNRMLRNRLERGREEGDYDEAFMSTNKSIIFIKLPRRQAANQFKASLYENSLKRLKKQNATIIKDTSTIPFLSERREEYSSLEEEAIRRAMRPKNNSQLVTPSSPRQSLPIVSSPRGQEEARSVFEVDLSLMGFKNLKQKYLELRQVSLSTQKRSELLDKQHSKRSNPEDEASFQKYRMDKEIEQHMNRYNRKDLFHTRLNGFKTTLYPQEVPPPPRVRQPQQKDSISNFIRRRRMKSSALYNSPPPVVRPAANPEKQVRVEECSPWETDFIAID